jgi:hypothetical protein
MPDYSVAAVAATLSLVPGDVRADLVDTDEDRRGAVTEVHRYLDPHGERIVPELHVPDVLHRDWFMLGPPENDPRVV